MSFPEKFTRIKPDLPKGDWTVILRIAGVGDTPLNPLASDYLEDVVPKQTAAAAIQRHPFHWDASDGAIYTSYTAHNNEGTAALQSSTLSLFMGMQILGLEDAELQAGIAPTPDVSPNRPLPETFPYLDDVTVEARTITDEARMHPY